jgi:hypothetical protein
MLLLGNFSPGEKSLSTLEGEKGTFRKLPTNFLPLILEALSIQVLSTGYTRQKAYFKSR